MSASRSIFWNLLFRQGGRFILAGGLNSLLTLAVYEMLLFWLPYAAAFTIAFVLGIIFTGLVYTRFVFAMEATRKRFAINAGYYVVSYLTSLLLLDALIRWAGTNERLAIIVTMTFMVPVNFFALRLLLHRQP